MRELVGDDVDVDVLARTRDDALARAGTQHRLGPRAPAEADDDLVGVDAARVVQDGLGRVGPADGVERPAELFGEASQAADDVGLGGAQAVVAHDEDGVHLAAAAARGNAGGAAQQRRALAPTGEGDDDTVTCRPRTDDVMVAAVGRQALLDAVGEPQQRELAQGRQVALAEVVGERRVDLLRLVDVAVRHPPTQCLGRHVDEFDLLGAPDDDIRHRLALQHAGDGERRVVERFEVLDVDGGDDVDARREQVLDVLPPLLVAAARHVGVREFVDERDLRRAPEHGVEVHLLERRAPVLAPQSRHDLEALERDGRRRAPVGLAETDDDVRSPPGPASALGEHRHGLADAGGRTEVDAQRASCHASIFFCRRGFRPLSEQRVARVRC